MFKVFNRFLYIYSWFSTDFCTYIHGFQQIFVHIFMVVNRFLNKYIYGCQQIFVHIFMVFNRFVVEVDSGLTAAGSIHYFPIFSGIDLNFDSRRRPLAE